MMMRANICRVFFVKIFKIDRTYTSLGINLIKTNRELLIFLVFIPG
jgi:hypothetical protein